MPTCRDCNAPIVFRRTSKGNTMPVDARPDPDGNCRIDDRDVVVLSGDQLHAARAAGERLHLAHQVTCPAVQARRARKRIDDDTGLSQGSLL